MGRCLLPAFLLLLFAVSLGTDSGNAHPMLANAAHSDGLNPHDLANTRNPFIVYTYFRR